MDYLKVIDQWKLTSPHTKSSDKCSLMSLRYSFIVTSLIPEILSEIIYRINRIKSDKKHIIHYLSKLY